MPCTGSMRRLHSAHILAENGTKTTLALASGRRCCCFCSTCCAGSCASLRHQMLCTGYAYRLDEQKSCACVTCNSCAPASNRRRCFCSTCCAGSCAGLMYSKRITHAKDVEHKKSCARTTGESCKVAAVAVASAALVVPVVALASGRICHANGKHAH